MIMISTLLNTLQTGARANKYRVLVPMFNSLGEEIDILCQTASLPGKTLTPTEVILKGRKYLLRGEMSFDGSWEMTIVNTEDMEARNYFIDWMDEVHSTNMDSSGLLGNLTVAGVGLSEASRAIGGAIDTISNIVSNPMSLLGGIQASYQRDIKIEQLDHQGAVKSAVRLIGAFPTSVSAVEYNDATGEVSTTTITFAYTDIQVDKGIGEAISDAVFGESTTNLFT